MSGSILFPVDFDAALEVAAKPALPEGKYLAAIWDVKPHLNADTGSYGLKWKFIISPNPISEGWSLSESKPIVVNAYTFAGRIVDGKLRSAAGNFNLIQICKCFGVKQFQPEDVLGRTLILNLVHSPSWDDQKAIKENPAHEVQQYVLEIKGYYRYVGENNEICPRVIVPEPPEQQEATEQNDAW